jgi:uncharacterized membrane protein YfcA
MTPADAALVAGAGLLAGAVNAVAGGGTLISFPALLAAGLPAVSANTTSSVGLLAGYVGGSLGYRRELAGQGPRIRALAVVSVLGGILGAVLLLVTPEDAFRSLVPYLVLLSCALLAAQPKLSGYVKRRRERNGPDADVDAREPRHDISPLVLVGVGIASIYGSYFGAGLGVLLLAVLGVLLQDGLQRLNALKGLLSLIVNLVGVLIFAVTGTVDWAFAAILAVSALAGGYFGVGIARRIPAPALRAAVVVFGTIVAVALLVRG